MGLEKPHRHVTRTGIHGHVGLGEQHPRGTRVIDIDQQVGMPIAMRRTGNDDRRDRGGTRKRIALIRPPSGGDTPPINHHRAALGLEKRHGDEKGRRMHADRDGQSMPWGRRVIDLHTEVGVPEPMRAGGDGMTGPRCHTE